MAEKTTIQIFVETRDRLRNLGERNEDYDSIINRAISGEFANHIHKDDNEKEVPA